jgi:hypothetical protein
MKKTIIVASAIILSIVFNPLHAQSFDWHRLNITADFSFQPTMVRFGGGIFSQHPNRSASVGLGYRLGQRWEVNLYANLVGANAMSSGQQMVRGQMVRWIYVEDRYDVGWGAAVQWHTVPYRLRHAVGFDMTLRVGFDIGEAEADNVWAGLRWTYDLSRHVALSFSSDVGTFYFGRSNSMLTGVDMKIYPRASFGVQVEL